MSRSGWVAAAGLFAVAAGFWSWPADPAPHPDVMAQLEGVQVGERVPVVYDRDRLFGRWTDPDGNGCDTREDTILRDAEAVELGPGCRPVAVVFTDPLTGRRLSLPGPEVQVDHVVALDYAYGRGAEEWSRERRVEFANDPANLWATWGRANGSKGSKGVGDLIGHAWDPDGDGVKEPLVPRAQWCDLSSRTLVLVRRYEVRVSVADRAALQTMLSTCE